MIVRLTLIFAISILTVALFGCGNNDSNGGNTDASSSVTQQPVKPTKTIPKTAAAATTPSVDFSNVYAYDVNGQRHQFSEWLGKKPTVVNFWGTWCPPCRREIPDLIKLYDEYKSQGVEIVSIAVKDTPEKVVNFTRDAGMDWVMLMFDRDHHVSPFKLSGSVPTTIFYDKNGVETDRFVGARPYEMFKPAFEHIAM